MAKKKAAPKKVAPKRASRKKTVKQTTVVTNTHTNYQVPPFQYQRPVPNGPMEPPPYPVPGSTDTTSTTTTTEGEVSGVGGDLSDLSKSFADAKSLYKSKNFWGAMSMFGLSLLTTIGTFPQVASNPVVMGCVGMAFAVLWIVFRFMTNQAVSPAINMPHPNEWFKKKEQRPVDNQEIWCII